MLHEPPPNPEDWICDGLPPRQVSESIEEPQESPTRYEEEMTWSGVLAARSFAFGRYVHQDL